MSEIKDTLDEYIKCLNEIEELKDYSFSADIVKDFDYDNEKCDCVLMTIRNDKLNLSGKYCVSLEDFKANQDILAAIAREAIRLTELENKKGENKL